MDLASGIAFRTRRAAARARAAAEADISLGPSFGGIPAPSIDSPSHLVEKPRLQESPPVAAPAKGPTHPYHLRQRPSRTGPAGTPGEGGKTGPGQPSHSARKPDHQNLFTRKEASSNSSGAGDSRDQLANTPRASSRIESTPVTPLNSDGPVPATPSTTASGSGRRTCSSLYKTELCRSWEETGTCRYGNKCQFAHSEAELRYVSRHPKYKTETCRTFSEQGWCPYGRRCCFIHEDSSSPSAAKSSAAQHPGPCNTIADSGPVPVEMGSLTPAPTPKQNGIQSAGPKPQFSLTTQAPPPQQLPPLRLQSLSLDTMITPDRSPFLTEVGTKQQAREYLQSAFGTGFTAQNKLDQSLIDAMQVDLDSELKQELGLPHVPQQTPSRYGARASEGVSGFSNRGNQVTGFGLTQHPEAAPFNVSGVSATSSFRGKEWWTETNDVSNVNVPPTFGQSSLKTGTATVPPTSPWSPWNTPSTGFSAPQSLDTTVNPAAEMEVTWSHPSTRSGSTFGSETSSLSSNHLMPFSNGFNVSQPMAPKPSFSAAIPAPTVPIKQCDIACMAQLQQQNQQQQTQHQQALMNGSSAFSNEIFMQMQWTQRSDSSDDMVVDEISPAAAASNMGRPFNGHHPFGAVVGHLPNPSPVASTSPFGFQNRMDGTYNQAPFPGFVTPALETQTAPAMQFTPCIATGPALSGSTRRRLF